MELIVHRNPEAEARGINPFDHGAALHTEMWKTEGLKQALDAGRFDIAFGGARRDEEMSRAKERIFSVRSARPWLGPEAPAARALAALQRPPRARARACASSRSPTGPSATSGPMSRAERLEVASLYFAAERPTVVRDGTLLIVDDERFRRRGRSGHRAACACARSAAGR